MRKSVHHVVISLICICVHGSEKVKYLTCLWSYLFFRPSCYFSLSTPCLCQRTYA